MIYQNTCAGGSTEKPFHLFIKNQSKKFLVGKKRTTVLIGLRKHDLTSQSKVKYFTLKNGFVKIRLSVSARIINQVTYYARTGTITPYNPPLKRGINKIKSLILFIIRLLYFASKIDDHSLGGDLIRVPHGITSLRFVLPYWYRNSVADDYRRRFPTSLCLCL